jgi:hypothetical protein
MVLQDNETGPNSATPGNHGESDAKRLADKHMADPNHVITDEDLRSIRVGVVSEPDAPTKQAVAEHDEKAADHKADSDADTTPGSQKSTPWDVIT